MAALPRSNVVALATRIAEAFRFTPAEDPGDIGVAVGLMHRCGRQIEALIALEATGHLDSADSIVRSLFEHAATGLWLLHDPGPCTIMMLRSQRADFKQLAAAVPEVYGPMLESVDRVLVERGTTHSGARTPKINVRPASVGLDKHYYRYQEVCTRSHATILAIALGRSDPTTHAFERGYLLYGTWIASALAVGVHATLASPQAERLVKMGEMFAAMCDGKIDLE